MTAKRISQRPHPWLSLLPLCLALAVFGFVAVHPPGQGRHPVPPIALLLPFFAMLLIAWFMHRFFSGLAREVWDDGDSLKIVFAHHELRLPLRDISNLSYNGLSNPPRATLSLRHDTVCGREISFLVQRPWSLDPFRRNPIIDDLIQHIDQQRSS